MTYPILRPHLFTVSLLCALLSACGNDAGTPGAAAKPGAGGPPPAPEVAVLTVHHGDAMLTRDLPGRLQAWRTAQVRARVEGILEKRLFAEGSEVKAGQQLFRIDRRTLEANYAAAKAGIAGLSH